MASADMVLRVLDLPQAKRLVAAARQLVAARNAGADCYEARLEVDAVERALADLDGFVGKVCSECREPWAPQHFHLGDFTWVEP